MDSVSFPVSNKQAPVHLCATKGVAQNFTPFLTRALASTGHVDYHTPVLDITFPLAADKAALFGGQKHHLPPMSRRVKHSKGGSMDGGDEATGTTEEDLMLVWTRGRPRERVRVWMYGK